MKKTVSEAMNSIMPSRYLSAADRSRCPPSRGASSSPGSPGCSRSHSGRRLRTGGTWSKLCSGGGEVVAHSSVQASHGLSPAGFAVAQAVEDIHDEDQHAERQDEAPRRSRSGSAAPQPGRSG